MITISWFSIIPQWLRLCGAEHSIGLGQGCSGWWLLLLPMVRYFVAHTSVHLYWFMVASSTASRVKSSAYDDRWTEITICFPHTDINMLLTMPPLHPSSSICEMQLESWLVSEIGFHQWRTSQTRWRLVHWRRRRWCTKVSLGHFAGLWKVYSTAKRRRAMLHTDRRLLVRRISWALNLGHDRHLLAHILILIKYRSFQVVGIIWRWP